MTGAPGEASPWPPASRRPPTILAWGTYDLGKPRTRILLRGLREAGARVLECHAEVWAGIEDKSRVQGSLRRAALLARWLARYPRLVLRYLRSPRHDAVLVGYPGFLDVLVLRPWAGLRRVPLVWDVFVPLHEALVEDRALLPPRHPLARLLLRAEGAAARRADRLVLDTRAQAERFRAVHSLPEGRLGVVPVGFEPEVFTPLEAEPPAPPRDPPAVPTALFYGQMIPLHGIDTILAAAASPTGRDLRWRIVGRGQEEEKVKQALPEDGSRNLEWVPWVAYRQLREEIAGADVCLGVFGTGAKAGRVIPNKVYQILAVGKPLVTRDGAGIRELLGDEPDLAGVRLIPPGDGEALAAAVAEMAADRRVAGAARRRDRLRAAILPAAVGRQLLEQIEAAISARARGIER